MEVLRVEDHFAECPIRADGVIEQLGVDWFGYRQGRRRKRHLHSSSSDPISGRYRNDADEQSAKDQDERPRDAGLI